MPSNEQIALTALVIGFTLLPLILGWALIYGPVLARKAAKK